MKLLLAPLAIALLATGCAAPAASNAPAPEPLTTTTEAAPTTLPAGKFKLTTISGAEIKFTLPTPATDPAVKDLEAYRAKTKGEPVTYLVADVDNRKGTDMVNMYQVNAFDKDGRQYTFSTVTEAIDLWEPSYQSDGTYLMPNGRKLSDAEGSPLSREGSLLNNAHLGDANVAERATLILASTDTDLPAEFTRVSVQPSGGGEGEDAQAAG